jgi:hypothetical protein
MAPTVYLVSGANRGIGITLDAWHRTPYHYRTNVPSQASLSFNIFSHAMMLSFSPAFAILLRQRN